MLKLYRSPPELSRPKADPPGEAIITMGGKAYKWRLTPD